jgi:hypothetical protein
MVFTVREVFRYAIAGTQLQSTGNAVNASGVLAKPDVEFGFVADQLSNGNRFRWVTVMDCFTRECNIELQLPVHFDTVAA